MPEFTYVIKDKLGIHARPAVMVVKKVNELGCPVDLMKGEKTADASRLMAIMQLGVKCGDFIKVSIDSEDKNKLLELKSFFETSL